MESSRFTERGSWTQVALGKEIRSVDAGLSCLFAVGCCHAVSPSKNLPRACWNLPIPAGTGRGTAPYHTVTFRTVMSPAAPFGPREGEPWAAAHEDRRTVNRQQPGLDLLYRSSGSS